MHYININALFCQLTLMKQNERILTKKTVTHKVIVSETNGRRATE